MSPKYHVEFYRDADGSNPVQEYILEGNDKKKIALLIAVIERLENLGPELQGTNMDKLIKGPIRELRKDRHRILYGRDGNTYVLLTAFPKSTQKTPPEQIELSQKRFGEYLRKKLVPGPTLHKD